MKWRPIKVPHSNGPVVREDLPFLRIDEFLVFVDLLRGIIAHNAYWVRASLPDEFGHIVPHALAHHHMGNRIVNKKTPEILLFPAPKLCFHPAGFTIYHI